MQKQKVFVVPNATTADNYLEQEAAVLNEVTQWADNVGNSLAFGIYA